MRNLTRYLRLVCFDSFKEKHFIQLEDDIDNIGSNIEDIKNPRVMEKIKNDKDLAILSKDLVTIDLEVR